MPKGIIYELAYLISGQLNEAEAQELAKKIEKRIGENNIILSSIEPKKIKLAYSIKKQGEGYLVSTDFTCEPKNILELSKAMEKEVDVLRFLTIKKSPKKPDEPKEESKIQEIKKTETTEEKLNLTIEKPTPPNIKEKQVKKPISSTATADKEEDLKKIEKDLDEILGQ